MQPIQQPPIPNNCIQSIFPSCVACRAPIGLPFYTLVEDNYPYEFCSMFCLNYFKMIAREEEERKKKQEEKKNDSTLNHHHIAVNNSNTGMQPNSSGKQNG